MRAVSGPDKGKVERFIRYLRESFWVPLSSRLAQEGLIVDRETANLAATRWLREVANARIHGTTGAIPAERLVSERLRLQPVPTPYGGRTVVAIQGDSYRLKDKQRAGLLKAPAVQHSMPAPA
jgi:hypothetical protein